MNARADIVESSLDTNSVARTRDAAHLQRHPSVRTAVGEKGWAALPPPVRARFADDVLHAEYLGEFETVAANWAGKLLAFACRLIRSPIAPHTGQCVPATVRVFANPAGGMVWERIYRFAGVPPCAVSSIKQLDRRGAFVEALPMGLRMPLDVFERNGVLHFVSRGYHFEWLGLRVSIPDFLPPGQTHVEHIDEGDGWFRFTMTVTHKWFGRVFFQTGRFRAASEPLTADSMNVALASCLPTRAGSIR